MTGRSKVNGYLDGAAAVSISSLHLFIDEQNLSLPDLIKLVRMIHLATNHLSYFCKSASPSL